MRHSFQAAPHRAGRRMRHEDAVGHRQIRRSVTVEDELAAYHRPVHPRGLRPRCDDRYSVSASATKLEIVTPERAARRRTRAASTAGSFTVNTTPGCGATCRPAEAA
jgi:hypothetical protein